jgi:hypothetical protein
MQAKAEDFAWYPGSLRVQFDIYAWYGTGALAFKLLAP